MKKGLLILSALAVFACSACTIKVFSNSQPASEQTSENPQGGSQQGGSQGGTSQGGTSQGGTSQGGGSQTSGHDGKSVATAYTVDELLANVNFTTTPSTEIYYVTGTCVAADEYVDATNHRYSYYFEGHTKSDAKPFQMYSGVFADTSKTPASLAGCTITFHGKAFIFQKDGQPNIYEIGYKKDVADNPVIDAISGESTTPTTSESQPGQTSESQGGQTADYLGAHASQTGEVPAGAQTISFDFTTMTSFGDMPLTSKTEKCYDGTVTAQEKDWNYGNASFHTSDTNNPQAYLALYAKEAKAVAYFGNKTSLGKIVKVAFTLTSNASTNAKYVIDFGQSALSASTSGSGLQVTQAGNELYVEPGFNATHFAICARQGVSSTGKASWYNINIATLTVTYVAA